MNSQFKTREQRDAAVRQVAKLREQGKTYPEISEVTGWGYFKISGLIKDAFRDKLLTRDQAFGYRGRPPNIRISDIAAGKPLASYLTREEVRLLRDEVIDGRYEGHRELFVELLRDHWAERDAKKAKRSR